MYYNTNILYLIHILDTFLKLNVSNANYNNQSIKLLIKVYISIFRYSNTVTLILVSLFGLLLVLTSISCIFCSSLHNIWCWRRSRKLLGNRNCHQKLNYYYPLFLQTSGSCPE